MKSLQVKKILIFIVLILTSIKSYNQEIKNDFPYELNLKKDAIIFSSGVFVNLGYIYLRETTKIDFLSETELNNLNANDINSFDRYATENWSPKHSEASSIIKNTLRYSPAIFFIPYLKRESWNKLFTLGVIYMEGYLLSSNLTGCTKRLVQRKRPYLYNTTSISEDEKYQLSQENNAYYSFYSGHTSSAFYSASFISKVFSDIYGRSGWSYTITAVSYSAAATVGYLRITSGNHFPTDVIVGAIIGSTFGLLIPELHKKKNDKLLIYLSSNNQIGLIYTF